MENSNDKMRDKRRRMSKPKTKGGFSAMLMAEYGYGKKLADECAAIVGGYGAFKPLPRPSEQNMEEVPLTEPVVGPNLRLKDDNLASSAQPSEQRPEDNCSSCGYRMDACNCGKPSAPQAKYIVTQVGNDKMPQAEVDRIMGKQPSEQSGDVVDVPVMVMRVIEENGQDYAVVHVDEIYRLQSIIATLQTTPAAATGEEAVERVGNVCKICNGYGKCNDADLGDIYHNEWTCTECQGKGGVGLSAKIATYLQKESMGHVEVDAPAIAQICLAAMQPSALPVLNEDEAVAIMKASKAERVITKRYSEFNDNRFEEHIEYIQTDRGKYRALLAAKNGGK